MSLKESLIAKGIIPQICWVVYPCEQWRKEYPYSTPAFIWNNSKFAAESANDTDGFRVKIRIKLKELAK